jgi:hypothetical protein
MSKSTLRCESLSEEQAQSLIEGGVGYFGPYGAVMGDCKEVIIEGRTGCYLTDAEEFHSAGTEGLEACMIRPSARLLLAIGGLPETEDESLAKELSVSLGCARDIIYLRSRSRWTPKLEAELIQLHSKGVPPNICKFGSTCRTQATLYWNGMDNKNE